jgi:pilus assembly protein CpaB
MAVIAMMLLTAAALGLIALQVVHPRQQAAVETTAPAPLQTFYLVATHALPAGTLVVDGDLLAKAAPASAVPPGAIVDTQEAREGLRGALVRAYVDAGGIITSDAMLRPRERGFLASVLEPGTRAVTVGVDPVSGVAGLIWPGDRVDVILTQELDTAPLPERVLSETILRNVRVIGVDQEIVQGAPAGTAVAGKLARTVTLQVDSAQAEKVAVAQRLGKLLLTICSAREAGPSVASRPTTFGSDVSAALSRNNGPPVGRTVQLVEGNTRREVNFK